MTRTRGLLVGCSSLAGAGAGDTDDWPQTLCRNKKKLN